MRVEHKLHADSQSDTSHSIPSQWQVQVDYKRKSHHPVLQFSHLSRTCAVKFQRSLAMKMKMVNYERRQRLRRIRLQEIRKLRAMLPQSRTHRRVDEVRVVLFLDFVFYSIYFFISWNSEPGKELSPTPYSHSPCCVVHMYWCSLLPS